jgi:hypothetical protein
MSIDTSNYTSRRALKQPFVVECKECLMSFFVENLTPFTISPSTIHCILCGGVNIVVSNNYEDDKWRAIAANIGLPKKNNSAQLIKKLYELWEPLEYEWFQDFVKASLNLVSNETTVKCLLCEKDANAKCLQCGMKTCREHSSHSIHIEGADVDDIDSTSN